MQRVRRPIRQWLAASVVAAGLLASPAFAQKHDEKLPPYDVQGLKRSKQWVPWVFAFAFAGLIVLTSFKNPHRSHLD